MREDLAKMIREAADAAQPVFVAQGWTWSVRDGQTVEPYVPSVEDVQASLVRMFVEMEDADRQGSSSSGRLVAWRERSLGYLTCGVQLDVGCVHEEEDPEHLRFDPDWTIAPGATLDSWREEKGLTFAEAASLCSMTLAEFCDAVDGCVPLTHTWAERLEGGTGIPARFWLNREHNHRDALARGKVDTTRRAARFRALREMLKRSFGGGMVPFDSAYMDAVRDGLPTARAQTLGVEATLDVFEQLMGHHDPENTVIRTNGTLVVVEDSRAPE